MLREGPRPDDARDRSGREQARAPKHAASEIGALIESGRLTRAMSIWQWRDLRTGERIGLHLLVSLSSDIRVGDPKEPAEEIIEF